MNFIWQSFILYLKLLLELVDNALVDEAEWSDIVRVNDYINRFHFFPPESSTYQ